MSDLKPCPFCGSRQDLENYTGFVKCGKCGAEGPVGKSNWNDRAGDSEALAAIGEALDRAYFERDERTHGVLKAIQQRIWRASK